MRITSVEAIHLRAEDPLIELFDGSYDDCVLVVQTDTGLTGIGETESMAPAIQAIVRGPSAHNHARALAGVLSTVAGGAGLGTSLAGLVSGGQSNNSYGTIGGIAATVQFAGLSPGYVGLYQVNVVVPKGVTVGPAVPVVITQNGISSNMATIAIH